MCGSRGSDLKCAAEANVHSLQARVLLAQVDTEIGNKFIKPEKASAAIFRNIFQIVIKI